MPPREHEAAIACETHGIAFRLIDRSNAPATKGWLGDVDFRADYEKLWGKK